MSQHEPSHTIIVFGATSAIAQACCHEFAKQGFHLFLLARDCAALKLIASDLAIRYEIKVNYSFFDALDNERLAPMWRDICRHNPNIAGTLLAFGDSDSTNIQQCIDINFTSNAILLQSIADSFEQQRSGFIIAISSVAGDRGRKKNYIYGAAKAGLSTLMAGLHHRLSRHDVNVVNIKPGVIDTKMTFGHIDSKLMGSPQRIAKSIVNSIKKRKHVYYLPWFWRYIMIIIRTIPNRIFQHLNI